MACRASSTRADRPSGSKNRISSWIVFPPGAARLRYLPQNGSHRSGIVQVSFFMMSPFSAFAIALRPACPFSLQAGRLIRSAPLLENTQNRHFPKMECLAPSSIASLAKLAGCPEINSLRRLAAPYSRTLMPTKFGKRNWKIGFQDLRRAMSATGDHAVNGINVHLLPLPQNGRPLDRAPHRRLIPR